MIQKEELKELSNIVLNAYKLAESNILTYYQRGIQVEWKSDKTPVTIADKTTEEILREFFKKETPDFGIIGEEFGIENKSKEFQWIIDPIDGTKSFIHSVPLFGTLIALYHQGEPLVSLIGLPAQKSALWAIKDGGAFVDGRSVKVSSTARLEDALLLSGTINTIEKEGYGDSFKKLRDKCNLYRGWGDCYGYYLVALGKAEIMFDPVVSLWDIAPMPLIFKESGGFFSTLGGMNILLDKNGVPNLPIYEGYSAVASNGLFHNKILDIINDK